MSSTQADPRPDVADTLTRQEQRRLTGTPTVSVLVGPAGHALQVLAEWANGEGRGRGLVVVAAESQPACTWLDAWVGGLCRHRDLRGDALTWLAACLERSEPRAGRPAGDMGIMLARLTRSQRDGLLATVVPEASARGVEAAGRAVVKTAFDDPEVAVHPQTLLNHLRRELATSEPDDGALIVALSQLVPRGQGPLLVLMAPGAPGQVAAWVSEAARWLGGVFAREPSLGVAVVASEAAFEAIREAEPGGRAALLFRELATRLEAPRADAIRRVLGLAPERAQTIEPSIRRLEADGASPHLLGLFRDADAAVAAAVESTTGTDAVPDPVLVDRARSAAERFLHERLESLPETAGRFQLNRQIHIRFGSAPMEVDLLAADPRVAVEIDGYYHFRDTDAYRRDRRKDLALQKAGYLVVRFLANDVVERLEVVLTTILLAVSSRREPRGIEERS